MILIYRDCISGLTCSGLFRGPQPIWWWTAVFTQSQRKIRRRLPGSSTCWCGGREWRAASPRCTATRRLKPSRTAGVSHLRHPPRGADRSQEPAATFRLHRESDDRLRGGASGGGSGGPKDRRAHPGVGRYSAKDGSMTTFHRVLVVLPIGFSSWILLG